VSRALLNLSDAVLQTSGSAILAKLVALQLADECDVAEQCLFLPRAVALTAASPAPTLTILTLRLQAPNVPPLHATAQSRFQLANEPFQPSF